MENHTGLLMYINQKATNLTDIGQFSINEDTFIKLKIKRNERCIYFYIKNIETKQLIAEQKVKCIGVSDEEIFKKCCDKINAILKICHSLQCCQKCGRSFGYPCSRMKFFNYGFKNQMCSDCGMQNVYDTLYSDITCSVCQDSVGFGIDDKSICGDERHKLHSFCRKKIENNTCPLCRKGSDSESEFRDFSVDSSEFSSGSSTSGDEEVEDSGDEENEVEEITEIVISDVIVCSNVPNN